MKTLIIRVKVGEGFKNHAEAFDYLHYQLPAMNFDTTGVIFDGEGGVGTLGTWEVIDDAEAKAIATARWTAQKLQESRDWQAQFRNR